MGNSSVKIIDPKRANNGGIILARVKISFDEIARVIDKMEDSSLTQQQLQGIIEYLPSSKEINSFNEYLSRCVSNEERLQLIDSMCECEKFMAAMMNVKDAEKKIRALLFRMEFDNAVKELEQDATLIDDACSELSSSLRLRKLLGIVLNVGNRVNMGAATAFSITSLLKLNHAKSMNKKTTFLHYVVTVAKRNDESILDFKEEIPSLFKAEKVFWDHCLSGVIGLEDHLSNIKTLVLSTCKDTNRSMQSVPYETNQLCADEAKILSSTFVGQFVLEAGLKVKGLRQRIDKANQSYTKLLQYFHEETLKSHDFFNIFVQFSRNVDAAMTEIKIEEKAKQRKRIAFNRSNSVSVLNVGKEHIKHTQYRGRRYLVKCQSTSNLNLNKSSNNDDHMEEMSEIKLQQSASLNYNSVLAELKAKASPLRKMYSVG